MIDARIGSVNIKNFPDIPDEKVRSDAREVSRLADIIGFQEIGEQDDRLALREEMIRKEVGDKFKFIVFRDEKGRKTPNPIAYRHDMFKVVDKGTVLCHEALPGVSGPRSFSWAIFESVDGGFKGQFMVINSHFISGAWNDKDVAKKKERQELWTIHYLLLKDFVREAQKSYTVVCTGDYNRQGMRPLTRKFVIRTGPRSIDYIQDASHENGPTFKYVKTVVNDLKSDHHAHVAHYVVKGKRKKVAA